MYSKVLYSANWRDHIHIAAQIAAIISMLAAVTQLSLSQKNRPSAASLIYSSDRAGDDAGVVK